jgi:hypothetical protein
MTNKRNDDYGGDCDGTQDWNELAERERASGIGDAKPAIDFSDLDYLPGDDVSKAPPLQGKDVLEISAEMATRTLKTTNRARVEVPCVAPGCRNGTWYTSFGRPYGLCHRCKGTGKILRAANYEANKKAREERRARQAAEEQAEYEAACQRRIDAFKAKHPDLAGWLAANRTESEFARSLCDAVANFGNLSVGQEAAVRKILDRDAEAKQAAATGGELDVSNLKGYYAVPDGETRLKVLVSHPGKQSRWYGYTFVSDGAAYGERRTYGKQSPTGKYQGQIQDQLRAILADPRAAQIAYGKLTGVCGVCGRKLEDEASVAAGIGPICANKEYS